MLLSAMEDTPAARRRGRRKCRRVGYHGRMALAELFEVGDDIPSRNSLQSA